MSKPIRLDEDVYTWLMDHKTSTNKSLSAVIRGLIRKVEGSDHRVDGKSLAANRHALRSGQVQQKHRAKATMHENKIVEKGRMR